MFWLDRFRVCHLSAASEDKLEFNVTRRAAGLVKASGLFNECVERNEVSKLGAK